MSRFPGIPSQNSDLTLSSPFRKIVEADHEDREAIGHTSSTMKVPRAWESCLFAWLTSLCRDCRPISARYGNAVWIHCRPPSMAKSPIVVNGTRTSLTASSLDDHTHWSDCCLSWKSARRSLCYQFQRFRPLTPGLEVAILPPSALSSTTYARRVHQPRDFEISCNNLRNLILPANL